MKITDHAFNESQFNDGECDVVVDEADEGVTRCGRFKEDHHEPARTPGPYKVSSRTRDGYILFFVLPYEQKEPHPGDLVIMTLLLQSAASDDPVFRDCMKAMEGHLRRVTSLPEDTVFRVDKIGGEKTN